eukprot:evm.model.scf_2487.1 EVM.evm.TU.scf_2487.1   scf_2487:494-1261(-)
MGHTLSKTFWRRCGAFCTVFWPWSLSSMTEVQSHVLPVFCLVGYQPKLKKLEQEWIVAEGNNVKMLRICYTWLCVTPPTGEIPCNCLAQQAAGSQFRYSPTGPRYSRQLLAFLEKQMATVERRRELAGLASTAPSGLLRKVLKEARKILAEHEGPFEIQTFCNTSDTRKRVSKVCGALKALSSGFAPEYGRELRVDARVPDDEYHLDVQYLQYMLRYIFEGKPLGRVDRRLTAEWSGFKDQFDAEIKALGVIDENE